MALRLAFGSETADSGEATNPTGTLDFAYAAIKHSGNAALRMNPAGVATFSRFRGVDATGAPAELALDDAWAGVWVHVASLPSINMSLLELLNSANGGMARVLYAQASGQFRLQYFDASNAAITLVPAVAMAVTAGSSYFIELRVQDAGVAAGAGIECRINGVVYDAASGLTLRSAARTLDRVTFGTTVAWTGDVIWDDLYVDDAGYLGEIGIEALVPNAAGNLAEWTLGTSTTFSAVNQIPHDTDTTYLRTTTGANAAHLFNLTNTSAAVVDGRILCLKPVAYIRDEGGASVVSVRVRTAAASQSASTAHDPGNTYVARARYIADEIGAGPGWSKAAADGVLMGVVNNAAVAARCTAMQMQVVYSIPAAAVSPVPRAMHQYRRRVA